MALPLNLSLLLGPHNSKLTVLSGTSKGATLLVSNISQAFLLSYFQPPVLNGFQQAKQNTRQLWLLCVAELTFLKNSHQLPPDIDYRMEVNIHAQKQLTISEIHLGHTAGVLLARFYAETPHLTMALPTLLSSQTTLEQLTFLTNLGE